MSERDAIFDVVFAACARQAQHPDENGGGIIGRAAAVVNALGIDGDLPMSAIPKKLRRTALNPSEPEPCATCGGTGWVNVEQEENGCYSGHPCPDCTPEPRRRDG